MTKAKRDALLYDLNQIIRDINARRILANNFREEMPPETTMRAYWCGEQEAYSTALQGLRLMRRRYKAKP